MDWIELKIDGITVLSVSTDSALIVQECTGKPIVSDHAGVCLTVTDRSEVELVVYRDPESLRTCLARWWAARRRSKLSGVSCMPNVKAWNVQAAKPNRESTDRTGSSVPSVES